MGSVDQIAGHGIRDADVRDADGEDVVEEDLCTNQPVNRVRRVDGVEVRRKNLIYALRMTAAFPSYLPIVVIGVVFSGR